jgi:hypothetical protein
MSETITLTIFGDERCVTTRAALEETARHITAKSQRNAAAVQPPPLLTYPARPIQGGRLELAPPKRGIWFAEPKFNGWRALVHTPSGTMWNRHGSRLTIEHCFREALNDLRDLCDKGLLWVDCEALERRHHMARGRLIVLDAIPVSPTFTATYTERRALLESLGIPQERFSSGIHTGGERPLLLTTSVPACAPNELLAFYKRLKSVNHKLGADFFEGIVMKRGGSSYPVQLRNATEECREWLKHRFL